MSSLPDITVALGWKPGPVDKELDENVLAGKAHYSSRFSSNTQFTMHAILEVQYLEH